MEPRQTRHNGIAIRYFRIKDGLKPGDLAAKAGVSYPHLDNIENERKDASVEVLYRLASALNVPAEALVRDPSYLLRPTRGHNLATLGEAATA